PDDKYELEIWEIWPSDGNEEPDKTIYPTPETVVPFTIEANVTDKSGEIIKKIGFQDVVNAAVENAGLNLQVGNINELDVGEKPTVTQQYKDGKNILSFSFPKPRAATVTIDKVNTVAPDQPASVTNVGTTTDAKLVLNIPQGVQGVQGFRGPTGKNGKDGLSAYQVAINNGFKGTEKEWLDSLKVSNESSVRHAPTGYTLDRTTNPWTIWFDNGCGLQFPNYGTAASLYSYGFSTNEQNTNLTSYPLTSVVMSASHGALTLDTISKATNSFEYWASNTKVINPIRTDADGYDWSNVYFNDESRAKKGQNYTDR